MSHGDSSGWSKALFLKFQQTAFKNAYLKAEAGIREVVTTVSCLCCALTCRLSVLHFLSTFWMRVCV